jgi:hypothetical protein
MAALSVTAVNLRMAEIYPAVAYSLMYANPSAILTPPLSTIFPHTTSSTCDLQVSRKELETVRRCKAWLNRLTARARKIRDMLESLLDDDHDMDCMYLGRRAEVEALQAQMVRTSPHTAHVHQMYRFSIGIYIPKCLRTCLSHGP